MVFTIAERLKDYLVDNNFRTLTEHEAIVERKFKRNHVRKGTAALDVSTFCVVKNWSLFVL
jgi:hypothetical protein